ncbi:selenocysteine lyase [Folsomia candida]|uniref:selenocysteine lyase n=1 Tax=Folsomia candida TaxID=158441 RepID=UPI000B8F6772|nr:selenocysteine lyase [Folsomia candida]
MEGIGKAYLDYNATTPLDPLVIGVITESLKCEWGNPSSAHSLGKLASDRIGRSREQVAAMINAHANDIVFMSGGTEANIVALQSGLNSITKPNSKECNIVLPHVITSNVEHDSVKNYLSVQQDCGKIDLSFAQVDKASGQLRPESVLSLVNNRTCLISVMHANNETGVLMPIMEIGQALKALNVSRSQNNLPKIYFHTDSAQSLGKVKVDVKQLEVDYLTIVGHKFYGPRIGALFVKDLLTQTPLVPLLQGGGQERGFRSGTENTPMIAGLGQAAELVVQNLDKYMEHMTRCRNALISNLKDQIHDIRINFVVDPRLPNTVSLQVPQNVTAQKVLENCNGKIFASLGAACHSNSQKPSSILMASGLSPEEAGRTIRISIGRTTPDSEIEFAVKVLTEACKRA